MHRLTKTFLWLSCAALLAVPSVGCGGQKGAESPSAEDKGGADEAEGEAGEGDGGTSEEPAAKKDPCNGFDIGNLEDLLTRSECEVPDAKPDGVPAMDPKGKLEVTASASPTTVAPGGKVDLLVTFANKTTSPLPLQFRIDPVARFETETYDAKGKRADMPAGKQPPAPKGYTAPPPADQKVAKVVLAPNGTARVRVPWEAVKMRWAPEKLRGSAVEKGYPRVGAGPLRKGKYTVKLVTPLVGVSEGAEHEVSAPKVDVEVAQ